MSDFWSPEEFLECDPNLHNNLKYRSLAVLSNYQDFQQSSFDIPYERVLVQHNYEIPEQPMLLTPNHFIINRTQAPFVSIAEDKTERFNDLKKLINAFLGCFTSYDFSFIVQDNYPMWKGKYIQGSSSCEIDLYVYSGDSSDDYIIEAIRIKGDAKPFHAFYKDFKSQLTNKIDEPTKEMHLTLLPAPPLTETQFLHAVAPFFAMSKCEFFETRLEAVKMLCDLLGRHSEHLNSPVFVQGCVQSLEALVIDDFEDVRQHAIIAFNLLVKSPYPSFRLALVRSTALPMLLSMVDRPPEPAYETLQVRREAAHVLATLAKFDAAGVLATLQEGGGGGVLEWAKRVPDLQSCDQALYQSAFLAKEHLTKGLATKAK